MLAYFNALGPFEISIITRYLFGAMTYEAHDARSPSHTNMVIVKSIHLNPCGCE